MASIVRVPYQITDGELRIDLPEWISGRSIVERHDDQTVTVRIHGDPDQVEQWAVEQGYHTPARITPGRFFIALEAKDPAVYAFVEAAIEANPMLKHAVREPYFSRTSVMVAQMQAAAVAAGLTQVTDEWLDELWREAFLWEL